MIISDFAIKRPLITVVAMVAMVIFGIFSLLKLKTDEFPDVAPPWLTVGVVYPGASPEVVESEVLKPVEEQIGSIAGVKRIMGKAYDGYSMLMIEFFYDKDLNVASQEVRDAISTIRADLPVEMKEPIISKFNDTDRPIISMAISSSVLTPAELTRLADPGITRELRAIPGVSDVQIFGKVERELTVEVDPHRLQAGVAQVHVGPPPRRRVLEHRQRPVVHERHRRERIVGEALLGVGVAERHQAIRRAIRQRPQDDRIDDGVDRGRGAGAEAEHEDDDGGEGRLQAELPQRHAKGVAHGETPGSGRRGGVVGEARVGRAGIGSRFAAKRQEARGFERLAGFDAGGRVVVAVGARREVDVLEMRGELVDGLR